jgi:hypothetical protein
LLPVEAVGAVVGEEEADSVEAVTLLDLLLVELYRETRVDVDGWMIEGCMDAWMHVER